MKAEILAPAGNREALNAAFAAGADAVYFALPLFGARAYAQNFSLEEAGEVIRMAHLGGKKVYVTMNTLLEESQMEQAADWARQLYEMGVDALIIQDLGLIHLLHHTLPDLELHASTQLSVSNPQQIERLRKLGISRVVLAREATLEEIEACAQTGMELEVFVHGALCISYSGQCRFSQVRYQRSGNKGACAQPCRMEYTLLKDGKPLNVKGDYLLSPRDLSLLEKIPALEKAGVASLKIEGRMKSPEYVYSSVIAARKASDGQPLSHEDKEKMMTAFNRGYTLGHTFQQTGKSLMNPVTSNHQGVSIGEVTGWKDGKAIIRLSRKLHQNDGLRFENRNSSVGGHANFLYDEKGRLVSQVEAGKIAQVKVKGAVFPGAQVKRTSSFETEKEVEHAIDQMHLQIPVSMKVKAPEAGKPMELTISDGKHSVCVSSPALSQAKQRPATVESVRKQLIKTGNSFVKVEKFEAEMAKDLFIPVSILNDLRRSGIESLEKKRLETHPQPAQPYDFHPLEKPIPSHVIEVQKPQQVLDKKDVEFVSEFPIPNTAHKASLTQTKGEYGAHLADAKIVEDMNVTNSYAAAALLELGYDGFVLSSELSEQGRKDLLKAFQERYGFDAPAILTVYEKPRMMLMKHCPINTALADGTRKDCSLCRQNTYTLQGKDGRTAWLYGSPECRMQIFDEQAINTIDQIGTYKKEGIHAFRMAMSDETRDECARLYDQFEKETAQN